MALPVIRLSGLLYIMITMYTDKCDFPTIVQQFNDLSTCKFLNYGIFYD